METVRHHGRTTAYRLADRGEGDDVCLFVHGSGADHRVWKAQDRLAREMTVVAVDLSGHGASTDVGAAPGPDAMTAYVRDVAAVAGAVGADVLVGNSLGGAVVLRGLIDGAVDPGAAVLVGSGAKLAVREDLRGWLASDFDRAIAFLHAPGRLFADAPDWLVSASEAAMRAVGRRVTERDFLTCHAFDVRDRLDAVDVPTLAIGGEEDALTPPAYHEYLADSIDDGRLAVVPDAAHLVMLERPEAFNGRLREFVRSVR